MYMTFGCSRSPVTVAVPNSSRSVVPGGFGPVPAPDRPPAACGGREVVARGSPASDWAVADRDVLARGSPASDWGVALAGLAGLAGAAAGGLEASVEVGAGSCAEATLMAQQSRIMLEVRKVFMRA